jgi:hypothetical protein
VRLLVLPSKPNRRLEAENAALRRQVAVLQRKVRGRARLTNSDRLFFVLLYRWFPSILKTMTVIKPETLVRLASGRLSALLAVEVEKPGRPAADLSRVAGLDPAHEPSEHALGCSAHSWRVAQAWVLAAESMVAKYTAKPGDGRSGQSWSTLLRNHLPDIAAIDLFVVPTIGFRLLYAPVIVRLARSFGWLGEGWSRSM